MKWTWTTRVVTLTNFCVTSSAFAFQVFVLYPWHHQLQHDFEKLRQEQAHALRTIITPETTKQISS